MSRAAILPYPGDPFLFNYWLKFFDTVWGDEIDKLYVYLNSPIEKGVIEYIRELCAVRPKINFTYEDHQIEHGDVINRALDIVEEDLVMLIEDDGFIFRSGMVNMCFSLLEEGKYDIVGSKRGSCAMQILTEARYKWDLLYEGEGDQGPNFWPNFFFTKKETLLATDRNFAAKAWNKGDIVPGIDYEVTDDVIYGDTFVNTSLQLRGTIPQDRIYIVPQYHGSPNDIEHHTSNKYLFDGKAPWTHVGSLSSGVGGVLKDAHNRSLARRKIDKRDGPSVLGNWCNTDAEKLEWERRVQWWATFYEYAKPNKKIAEFYDLYGNAVQRIISQYNLSVKNIRIRQRIYAELGL